MAVEIRIKDGMVEVYGGGERADRIRGLLNSTVNLARARGLAISEWSGFVRGVLGATVENVNFWSDAGRMDGLGVEEPDDPDRIFDRNGGRNLIGTLRAADMLNSPRSVDPIVGNHQDSKRYGEELSLGRRWRLEHVLDPELDAVTRSVITSAGINQLLNPDQAAVGLRDRFLLYVQGVDEQSIQQ